ncbi:MAG: hypothetical protein Q4D23_11035 [Bacteroidales bacterium]|nr:hypothetical protein [Bacteroidales bacterium]
MEISKTCMKAVTLFGNEHQIMKAIEEMGELTTALIQYRDGRVTPEDVETEIADVRIMMEQLAFIFDEDFVDLEYRRKLDRLKNTLDNL